MNFQKMKQALNKAYDSNEQFVRMQQIINDGHAIIGDHAYGKRKVPVLSGPTGIGKTACVKDFATEKAFELIMVDCSYMPSSTLAAHIYSSIQHIDAKQINGCVLLIDNINESDSDWLNLLEQYTQNYFEATVNIADNDKQHPIETVTTKKRCNEIPENLFIVGEQSSNEASKYQA